jgi:hypothetical protein
MARWAKITLVAIVCGLVVVACGVRLWSFALTHLLFTVNEAPQFGVQADFACMQVISDTDVWAGGDGLVHVDGRHWTQVYSNGSRSEVNALTMVSATEGWAALNDGTLPHHTGDSWIPALQLSSQYVYAFAALSSSDVWAVGTTYKDGLNTGLRLHFFDGQHWALVSVAGGGLKPLHAIVMLSPRDGWAAGDGGILHYDGQRWSAVEVPSGIGDVVVIHLTAPTNGWAIANRANGQGHEQGQEFLRYDGHSWNSMSLPGNVEVTALSFALAAEGWAVGHSGVLLHYTGRMWSAASSPVTPDSDLYAVRAHAANDVWIAGQDHAASGGQGAIWHFDGQRWSEIYRAPIQS